MLKLASLKTYNPFSLKKSNTWVRQAITKCVINNKTVCSSHRLVGPPPLLFVTGLECFLDI